MFKCDPHVHTDESSICGKIPAKEVVNLYKNAGFDTIFITDGESEGGIFLQFKILIIKKYFADDRT